MAALNRAVAVGHGHGPQAGIDAAAGIRDQPSLVSYYLLYAVLAEFETQLHDFESAARNLRKAIQLTDLKSEQLFLSKRLQNCEAQMLQASAV